MQFLKNPASFLRGLFHLAYNNQYVSLASKIG